MRVKERIKTVLVAVGLEPVVLWYWNRKGVKTDYLRLRTPRERFQKIYEDHYWSVGDSASGAGSSLERTSDLRASLPSVLHDLGVNTLLDVGCGDFNWMRHVEFNGAYIGIDIVPGVISANQAAYENEKRRFACVDAVSDTVPWADAALCREVLFHLSFADGKKLIANLRHAGIKYILCTTDPDCSFNSDIPTGAWRELNLSLKPFGFSEPIAKINDGQIKPSRIVGVWELSTISSESQSA